MEDNGATTGSPVHGTSRAGTLGTNTNWATDLNWKNVDDCTANSGTAYTAAPIVAGNNSFEKFQYGIFSGSYNQILNGLWSARTAPAGALATGLTLKGVVSSTYTAPATAANAALTIDYTAGPVAIGSGAAVEFSPTGPEKTSDLAVTLAAGGGYTQYLVSQLQTSGSAAAGDMATITSTLQYNEN